MRVARSRQTVLLIDDLAQAGDRAMDDARYLHLAHAEASRDLWVMSSLKRSRSTSRRGPGVWTAAGAPSTCGREKGV